jgi:hypothetical protein
MGARVPENRLERNPSMRHLKMFQKPSIQIGNITGSTPVFFVTCERREREFSHRGGKQQSTWIGSPVLEAQSFRFKFEEIAVPGDPNAGVLDRHGGMLGVGNRLAVCTG